MPPNPRRIAVVARRISGLSGLSILLREHATRTVAAGWHVDVVGERVDRPALSSAGVMPREVRPGWLRGRTAEWFARAAGTATASGYALVHGHGDALTQDVMSLHNCIHAVHEAVHGVPLDRKAPPAGAARMHERQLAERRFRALIANSQLMRDDVIARFGVPAESIRVVYPGFDPALYHPRPRTSGASLLRQRLHVDDRSLLVGLVTSGDWVKRGVADFIAVLGAVARDTAMSIHGVVTGKERSVNRYLALARQHGVADRLHLLPPTSSLTDVYSALDVFVYPAQLEEFGMCVQEAMASGLPVVCGRRIGKTELLDPPASELPLDVVTPTSVAERLAAFVGDPDLRRTAGALNAASVATNTWDRSAAGAIAIYNELAAS
jgi:UDP-glucose:(heptosyl)LPS alpha-1,3-glucosyltransferase